ncbi:hypothetical protein D3C76_406460 [compost metagenome]
MRQALAAFLLLIATPVLAEPWPELKLVSEHAIEGVQGGNLSGLAWCGDALWAVSDRDDNLLYRLDTAATPWQAQATQVNVPPVPDSGVPWGLRSLGRLASFVRGGELDFEGLSCDGAGNRYLVSEAHAAILQVPVEGAPNWLNIAPTLVRQARASGMLLHFNSLFEGLAINPAGDRIWLAAEREKRGLLRISRRNSYWDCKGGCVLLSEAGLEQQPAQMPNGRPMTRDFAGLSLFDDKLFTLERNAYRICRRDQATAQVERCWSFAAEGLAEGRRYAQPFGLAEALVIDALGAWVGLDTNDKPREDGERRPMVWRFAAPAGGWSAKS